MVFTFNPLGNGDDPHLFSHLGSCDDTDDQWEVNDHLQRGQPPLGIECLGLFVFITEEAS